MMEKHDFTRHSRTFLTSRRVLPLLFSGTALLVLFTQPTSTCAFTIPSPSHLKSETAIPNTLLSDIPLQPHTKSAGPVTTTTTTPHTYTPRAAEIDTSNATIYDPGFPLPALLTLAQTLPSHSWEYGTAIQALLELYTPSASVFSSSSTTLAYAPSLNVSSTPALVYARAHISILTADEGGGAASPDGLALGEGAVGDPASLGVGAVLLGAGDWTSAINDDGGSDVDAAVEKGRFWDAAGAQVEYLLGVAPRADNGAISQRVEGAEMWADFMYMVPPYLAYYGVVTGNASVVQEAVRQCALYREVLQPVVASGSGEVRGLWRHIVGPFSPDAGFWATGNGWAAAGMARVLAVVVKAPDSMFAATSTSTSRRRRNGEGMLERRGRGTFRVMRLGSEQKTKSAVEFQASLPVVDELASVDTDALKSAAEQLADDATATSKVSGLVLAATDDDGYADWLANEAGSQPRTRATLVSALTGFIQEILDAIVDHANLDGGLVRNYVDDVTNTDGKGFGEVSGSTLLASVMYRMAVLSPETFGNGTRYTGWADGVRKTLGTRDAAGAYVHIRTNGTAVPTVNPYAWGDTTPWTAGSPEGQNFVVLMYAAWRDCVAAGVCQL